MADNTEQFRWIVVIKENIDALYSDDDNVFVAGDLLWYPVEGRNTICAAPDTMVAFGRPKGYRGSYKQWQEDGIAPQVAFEILSPSNSRTEMGKKLLFYNQHGIEEYYVYDPETYDLEAWQRGETGLEPVEIDSTYESPRLGIRFDLSQDELQIFRPDGSPFESFQELQARADQADARADQADARADQANTRASAAEAKAEAMAAKLRELGIDPDQLE